MSLADLPRPLPRGPHRLSRDEVQRSQRDRLLQAMADAVAERGYAHTSVADVLRRARVSRATFYAQFSGKEECFLAAYDIATAIVTDALGRELRASEGADPLDRLDRVLTAYLAVLQAQPAMARAFLIGVHAVGPAAFERRRHSLDRFADLVAETHRGRSGLLGTEPHQRFAAEALVGAVSSMVTNLVGADEVDRLGELHAPLVELARTLTRRG